MHAVRTHVDINAPALRVWEVLTDFDAYAQWNPFIVSARGRPEVGAVLENVLDSNGSTMRFRPTVRVAVPGKELRWLGRLWAPRLLDGEHSFLIEETGSGGVRLTQAETFTGALVALPFVRRKLDVHDHFTAMNTALKQRAEQR
ncbi:SRPBCC domain-containing protein [Streptomyces durbertensis]|uniref:SRPBCC domain-containing protein n=1 Tax=Streptomyces durbertensis TaxID=2448886 RepID=UPI002B1FCD92|nr:SRPBCC domain-containing protein [Streptomyces durbertensis]